MVLQETIKLYSATRDFFRAPRIPTGRRALSLSPEPGFSHHADEAEFINHRRPSPSIAGDLDHTHQFNPVDIPRSRERARARLSVDEYISQREPLQVHLHPTPGLGFPSHASSEDDDDSAPPLNSPVDRLSMIDSPSAGRSFSRMHPAKFCRPFLSYPPLM
jgi:hypothetical protein